LRDDEGKVVMERRLPDRITCANAVASVALSTAIFLPELVTGSTPQRAEPPPPPPESPPSAPPPTKSAPPFRWRFDVGGLMNVGLTSGLVAGGLSAHGAVRWPSFSLSLGARYELFAN